MPGERFLQAVNEYVQGLGGMDAWRARRRQAQTDLWFLSKEIFHRDLFEKTHKPVVQFFLKKKPFAPAFRKGITYTLADFHEAFSEIAPLEKRKGILLYPRGSYKSSLDEDDITQYIICYPDVRILIMVGESSLGEAFVPNIKQRFVLEEGRDPTEFQMLFPEFVIDRESDSDKGGAQEFWNPARKLSQKEPTLGSRNSRTSRSTMSSCFSPSGKASLSCARSCCSTRIPSACSSSIIRALSAKPSNSISRICARRQCASRRTQLSGATTSGTWRLRIPKVRTTQPEASCPSTRRAGLRTSTCSSSKNSRHRNSLSRLRSWPGRPCPSA